MSDDLIRRRSHNFQDLTKQRFGNLVVLGLEEIHESPCGTKKAVWKCKCDCGTLVAVTGSNLRNGNTKSCGCYKASNLNKYNKKHDGTHDRLYAVWKSMKQRCNNPKHKSYKYYGGVGIKVCEEWEHNYSAFKEWAYQNGYDESAEHMKCTIDRIDPYKDYEPSNCRWVDMFEQNKDSHKRKGMNLCT